MAHRGMDYPAGLCSHLDALRAARARLSSLRARHDEPFASPARHTLDEPLLVCVGRCADKHRAGRDDHRLSGASIVPDDGRHHAHRLSQARFAQRSARMGDGGAGRKLQQARPQSIPALHVARRAACISGPCALYLAEARRLARRAAFPARVESLAARRALG